MTSSSKKIKRWTNALIGCSGWFTNKGRFVVNSKLRAQMYAYDSKGPVFTIVRIDDKNIWLSADGLYVSTFPKKYVTIKTP